MSLGALAFLNPWLLAALAALPLIYWLLRTVPPSPRQVEFPATRILVGIETKQKQPARTPWWLILIRMLAAAFVILALAEPVLNPNRDSALRGAGPVAIVVDNGWSSASRWSARMAMLERVVNEAEAQSRAVIVLPTALPAKGATVRIDSPLAARSAAAGIEPQPFAPQRTEALARLTTALSGQSQASIVWLSDGIDHGGEARSFAEGLLRLAGSGGTVSVAEPGAQETALGLRSNLGPDGRLEADVVRTTGNTRDGVILAFSNRGQRLGEARFSLEQGANTAKSVFELPLELRNQVTRLEVAGERSAGAIQLLDARSQWQRVGVISGASREQAQPLLSPTHYIEKAITPFAELIAPDDSNLASALGTILKRNASVIMLADIGTLTGENRQKVDDWVKKGGVLVRFAGPRLEKGGDDLMPVALRLGGRTLGGALSWSTPQALAPFTDDSLFAGLAAPPDVTVTRQVLADPARLGAEVKIWARLKDGTPLVTAAKRGDGQVVLFHVTANADWSNLPLSGAFVEMLRRISALGHLGGGGERGDMVADGKTQPDAAEVLSPLQTLDGFGTLRSPPPTAEAVPKAQFDALVPSASHPPGYYGPQGTPRSLNLIGTKTVLAGLPGLPSGVERRIYEGEAQTSLKPSLLSLALALIFADVLAVLILQGALQALRGRRAASAAAALVLALGASLALVVIASPAIAQIQPPGAPQQQRGAQAPPVSRSMPATAADALALTATAKVTFGYVITGDSAVDETSRQGLSGLVKVLVARTSVDPGEPHGVNILNDEIAFFPILYWPVLQNARALPAAALAKIDAYMKEGGMIVFDTRDYGQGGAAAFAPQFGGETPLQRLLGNLDVPRLEPVPEGHVMTKSFYLLRSFPGRWEGGQLWVEADQEASSGDSRKARRADGVSSILVTSNDVAAAWAMDDRGRPLYPTVPGGEMQREMSYRFGVNMVMYALTGNYKADQVHVPALLERLGN